MSEPVVAKENKMIAPTLQEQDEALETLADLWEKWPNEEFQARQQSLYACPEDCQCVRCQVLVILDERREERTLAILDKPVAQEKAQCG